MATLRPFRDYDEKDVINLFAFALIVGISIGTYSSLFVASPVMTYFEKRSMGPNRK